MKDLHRVLKVNVNEGWTIEAGALSRQESKSRRIVASGRTIKSLFTALHQHGISPEPSCPWKI
jgi:hypothetical protein